MPVITAIKQQKRKNRVNIHLDNKFGFGIDLENFIKLNLRVEQELTGREIEKIVKESELKKTFDKLINFAMIRPRSVREIENWFYRKKVHKSIQKKLLQKIKKLDLLDDKRFAEWWVRQRLDFRPRGKRALQYELREKGIDKKIIADVLEEIEVDEIKIARNLIRKNSYKWSRYDKEERKKKIAGFLGRKGFGWEIINKVI